MKVILTLLSVFVLTQTIVAQSAKATAADKPFALGITDQIHSAVLNEDRTLNIYLPQGYAKDSNTSYPVIYLLDGAADEDFIHIAGLIQFLNGIIDTMPPCILVGIANTDRKRDLTFPTTIEKDKKAYPTTGGSEKFISFIEKELQPYVQKKYKTTGQKVLVGQSLGGLLATEVLIKRPALFTDYLIVSPSLWWDNESLLTLAPKLLSQHPDDKRHVFIVVGAKEEDQMVADAKKLSDILHASGKKNLKTDYFPMPDENHLTILHNAVYKGFEVLFGK